MQVPAFLELRTKLKEWISAKQQCHRSTSGGGEMTLKEGALCWSV